MVPLNAYTHTKTILGQFKVFRKSNIALYAFDQSDGPLMVNDQSNGALLC